MSKYQKVVEQIEQNIIDNHLQQGDKLPTFQDLMKQYDVSKSTIVKALNILEKRGVIYQIQGSGVFVRRRKRTGYINFLESQGFTADLKEFQMKSKVLAVELIQPSEEVRANLKCEAEEQVYFVKRLRFINDQILCIEESYYRQKFVPYLSRSIAEESLFHYVEKALGLTISFSDKYLHVKKLDEKESELLELETGDPALFVEELFYLSTGEPFDFSRMVYHYEHSQFFVQSNGL
ncbi:GntR family transcriptional regulator [Listeria kieliensis]|uniref:GntR family transcriptional regulator n=1 Tax=Listeria kieliensis TaxID=1621700 RepID=A0A3D8TQA1_9LIST|nr:GntR family transcriptional regulator [Listeria kieliensis]RDX00990.1 GntR family transcriptional regulator [Listeria kieliensis]